MAGELVWFEMVAHDAERAKAFYGSLLGWQFRDAEMPGLAYHVFEGEPGGAIYEGESAGNGPIVYFGSEDIDADVARVRELGGQAEDKSPIPGVGWFARCTDPEGNSFSLYQSDASVQTPS